MWNSNTAEGERQSGCAWHNPPIPGLCPSQKWSSWSSLWGLFYQLTNVFHCFFSPKRHLINASMWIQVVKEALVRTLKEGLGEKYNEEVEGAWSQAYDHLALAIKAEMKQENSQKPWISFGYMLIDGESVCTSIISNHLCEIYLNYFWFFLIQSYMTLNKLKKYTSGYC